MKLELPGGAALEWAAASRALVPGAIGDACVVAPADRGALLAVIDGLGHGPEAALAARKAAGVVERHANQSLEVVIERCHEALRSTRGAVMSLVRVSAVDAELSWVGIGNVEALLVGVPRAGRAARAALIPRGGILGYRHPGVRTVRHAIADGDRVILATDGIRGDFVDRLPGDGEPREIADRILELHARDGDDALVLVARFSTSLGGDRARLPTAS